ncbi:hypothetical protein SSS_00400 [Sarcoptes scabiei]|nr:hypothetical protein SSS_00400 [Sarcoptes scabiei]
MIGELIRKVSKAFKVKIKRFICVGHSLGGQICGFTGKHLKSFAKLGMILGLDPAGPGFTNVERRSRLDYSDADLVLTIMTNAAKSVTKGYGTSKPVGHYNFRVNGGSKQPGCENASSKRSCAHRRSPELVIDDLTFPNKFTPMAYRCESYKSFEKGLCTTCKHSLDCQRFGSWFQYWTKQKLDRNFRKPLVYYVDAREKAPFSLFHYGIVLEIDPKSPTFKGKLSMIFYGAYSSRERFVLKNKFKPNTRSTFLFKTSEFLGRIKKIKIKIYSRSKLITKHHYIRVKQINVRFMNHQKERKPFNSVLLPERSSKIQSKRFTTFVAED